MMKTPLRDIDAMVVAATRKRLQDPHVVVPLAGGLYDKLWAILQPLDRFAVSAEMMNLGIPHLCAGSGAPVYVREGYTPGAGDAQVTCLPLDVLSTEDQQRVAERLQVFFAGHSWLHPPPPKKKWWRVW